MKRLSIFLIALTCCTIISCEPNDVALQEDEDLNLGGETSISGTFIQIFQQPASNLSASELDLHRDADRAFGDIFVTAPSDVNGGLGPVFNQSSCESCHTSNGRSPFPTHPDDLRGLLLRISVAGTGEHSSPLAVPNFGKQLQTKALFNKPPEGKLSWEEIEHIKTYLDGINIALTQPNFTIVNPYMPLPANLLISPRIAPPIIGLGLLEAVQESDILALADPSDANQDGISGKPNRVWNEQSQQTEIGKFGWKAGQPTLLQQTAAAYNNDMGITSPYFPTENCIGQSQADGLTDEPEIDNTTLQAATFYTQSLAVPQRRNTTDPTIIQGKQLFLQLNCGACHNPKFVTGAHPEYSFLSYQTIYPYTDLLLHDMGEGLADNRPDFEASGTEWRTPPLWGIGLTKVVGGTNAHFLHDGRAKTLEEAIMWHGGEAESAKEEFRKLSQSERETVIKFLESL